MLRFSLWLLFFLPLGYVFSQEALDIDWYHLEDLEYEYFYNEEYGLELPSAIFSSKVKALEGKTIIIEGYAYPIETDNGKEIVVLSKYPASQCFFCGGAGPESVMDLVPKQNFRRGELQMDDRLRCKGILKLNAANMEHLNYILEEVELLD